MNLLIADDEKIVRAAMAKKIECKKFGIDTVYEADNGAEALELFLRYAPEIVITDIRMPNMDGLQLAEEIRRHSADTRIIIISGYDEFEYARKAVRFFVDDYLLKPVSVSSLNESVGNAAKAISDAKKVKSILSDNEFIEAINGRTSELTVPENSHIIVFGFREKKNHSWDMLTNHALVRYGIINVLREIMADDIEKLVEDNRGNIVLLTKREFLSEMELKSLVENIRKSVENALEIFITAGASGKCGGRGINECYIEALRSLEKADSYDSGAMEQAVRYIYEHIGENLSLGDVARHVNVSATYFSAVFKKEIGVNFKQYITMLKIEMAKKMLSEKKLRVYEIAEKLGFENPRYFSSFFKKNTNMTTTEFQNLKK